MALNYKPLWIQLIQKEIRKIDLIQMAGLTSNTMAKMGKNEPISFKNLERICKALSCSPNDVISFDFEKEKGKEKAKQCIQEFGQGGNHVKK